MGLLIWLTACAGVPPTRARVVRTGRILFLMFLLPASDMVSPRPARAAPSETNYTVESWSVKDGLPHNSVHWLAQTPDGFLWAATGNGIARFDGSRFKVFDPASSPAIEDGRIRSVCVEPSGRLWALSENGSMVRRDGNDFVAVREEHGRPASGAHGLYTDSTNLLVVSDTQGRVYRLEGDRLVEWLDTRGAAPGPFIGINVDYDGTVWVRYGNILSWWDGQRWQRVRGPDGSESFFALKTGPAWAGGMWISGRLGLQRLQHGKWDSRFLAYETPLDSIQAILEDQGGNVWVTHAGGQLLRFDTNGRLTQSRRHNSLADGAVRHFFEDAGRSLWLATDGGLYRLRPKVPPPPFRPVVVIDSVQVEGRPVPLRALPSGDLRLTLEPGSGELEFRFTGVMFDEPERLQFRHRLDGVDSDWATSRRTVATYSNLPPGRLFFRVEVGREGEPWNSNEVTVEVTVLPHVWQTWWFRSGSAAVALGGVFLLLQRRETTRKRAQAQQDEFYRRLIESQETERQRIARELHDSLGQNLLLIKNRAVMGLKENATPEKMREQLQEISEASAGSVEEIRSIARALRPYQLDRLGLTKTLEDVAGSVNAAGGLRIEARVDNIDGLFAPDAEIGLYRIVQEGLNNVLKHAEAKSAQLTVRRDAGSVMIDLSDDGRGFNSAQKDGFGLTGVRERLRLLGGTMTVKSTPAHGTRLLLSIPIPSARPPQPRSSP